METRQASARLRKSFRYSNDADSDEGPEAMDEEEQEQLIRELKQKNDESNDLWLKCLLCLAGACFIVFVFQLVQAYSPQVRLVCILALTSTAMTAYGLLFIPTGNPKLAIYPTENLRPAQRFIPHMNGVLSTLIAVNGWLWRDRVGAPEGFWIASFMPLLVFSTVIVARRVLVEVNPDELWDLKYDLKGA